MRHPSIVLSQAGIRFSPPPAAQPRHRAHHALEPAGAVERGRYIVENVAMCELCHTPRDENGQPDLAHWLMGGPLQIQAAYPAHWAVRAPRIAGDPPGTDAQFIKLLTTGIARTGSPPNPPMPPFRMTREDAEAVLAYLKSFRR